MAELKKGDWVLVTKGKFRGWQGHIGSKEYDRQFKEYYYDIYPQYRKTRTGKVMANMVGLGMILNERKETLKKVV